MVVVKAVARKYPCGHSTECCSQSVKEGQRALLVQVVKDGVTTGEEVILHLRCLRVILKDQPLDPIEVESRTKLIQKAFSS